MMCVMIACRQSDSGVWRASAPAGGFCDAWYRQEEAQAVGVEVMRLSSGRRMVCGWSWRPAVQTARRQRGSRVFCNHPLQHLQDVSPFQGEEWLELLTKPYAAHDVLHANMNT